MGDTKDYVVHISSKDDLRRIQTAVDYYETVLIRNRENQRKKREKRSEVERTTNPKKEKQCIEEEGTAAKPKREKPKMQWLGEFSLAELMLGKPISVSAKDLQTTI